MVQRPGRACALPPDPELLLLNEPPSALDPAGRAEILSLVAAMRGTRTVIFSSHILADVQRIADQVGILREGRIGPDAIRIDATSIAAGERGIPAVIAACGARQVSCEPAAAVWNPRSSP